MSNQSDFPAWYNSGTAPSGAVMTLKQGVVPRSTADARLAMIVEFIAGTFSVYTWVDLMVALSEDPSLAKTLWDYAKVLGKVGAQTEWKG